MMTADQLTQTLGLVQMALKEEEEKLMKSSTLSSTDTLSLPIHSMHWARAALLNSDKQGLKKLLDAEPWLVNAKDNLGKALLTYAASSNKLKIAKLLLKRGSNLNVADNVKRTPLHWAVHWDHSGFTKFLLDKGADFTQSDADGMTPLHVAVQKSSTKCLVILLNFVEKREASNNSRMPFIDDNGRSLLHWVCTFGTPEHLTMLIKRKFLNLEPDRADKDGRTPLMFAVCRTFDSQAALACCQILYQKAPWIVRQQDKSGASALHYAVNVNNAPLIAWLLDQCRCDPNSISDSHFRTPLHWACKVNALEAIDLLLRHDVVLQADQSGATPLHYSAQEGMENVVEKLLTNGHKDEHLDHDGRTAMMYAVAVGANNVVDAMFKLTTVNIDQKDYNGFTLLHLAARAGHVTTLQLLLKRDLPLESVDVYGLSPLLSAAESGHPRCVQLLLKAGADMSSRCDRSGRTALHWAAFGGHAFVCQLLIKHGMNPDFADNGGRTPLHCAAFSGHTACISVLIQAGAETALIDNEGYSPLHLAAEEGHRDAVKALIEDGESAVNGICVVDDKPSTPLDVAQAKHRSDVIDYLLSLGGLTYDSLVHAAATKIQAYFRSYRVRKRINNREIMNGYAV